MAKKPYRNLPVTDYSHLPLLALPEVHDRMRDGEPLSLEISQQMPIHFYRPDVLHMMREFSVKDILVREGSVPVARTEIPSPSPFPEDSDAILARCAAHIAAIRGKSDALLAGANALVSPAIYYIERVANERTRLAVVRQLAEIERQCCTIRIAYEQIFCNAFASDAFFDEEDYRRMEKDIDAAFARQEEIIVALRQHI